MNPKAAFILDARYADTLAPLSDTQLGLLTRALLLYARDGAAPSFADQALLVAFNFIRADIDAAEARHKARCQRNRENARKRWARRNKHAKAPSPADTGKDVPGKPASDDCNALLKYWNDGIRNTGSLMPPVGRIDSRRRQLIGARIKEHGSADAVRQAFDKAFRTPFLNGHNKSRWIANFDWILMPANFSRVLDGVFSPQANKPSAPDTPKPAAPLPPEEIQRAAEAEARRKAERKRKDEDIQRDNILRAIKAAEQNPHSARAKVAYIAYSNGTMKSLGILWTPPASATEIPTNSTPSNEPPSINTAVAR